MKEKEKEKKFKDYLREIEELSRTIGMFNCDVGVVKSLDDHYKYLKKVRIEFFKWFKKQVKQS